MIVNLLKKEFPPLPSDELDERTKKAVALFKIIVIKAQEEKWQYGDY